MRRRAALAAVTAIAVLVVCVLLAVPHGAQGRSDGERPLFEVLHEAGYQGADGAWVESLADEQLAAIDIAYEHDVASGYQGTREEWISEKLSAHYDNSGDLVVTMPDGGEFSMPIRRINSGSASNATSGEDSEADGENAAQEGSAGEESEGAEDSPGESDAEDGLADEEGEEEAGDPGEDPDADEVSSSSSAAEDAERDSEGLSSSSASENGNAPDGTSSDSPLPESSDSTDRTSSDPTSGDESPDAPSPDGAASEISSSGDASPDAPPADDALATIVAADSIQAHSGDSNVAVAVRVEHNPGILGTTLSVSYDPSVLTLKSAENGEAFKDVLSLTRSRSYDTGCLFTWDGVDLSPADVKDGTILTLYFDVAPDAAPGIYPVAVREAGSTFNANLEEIGISVQDGSVVVG